MGATTQKSFLQFSVCSSSASYPNPGERVYPNSANDGASRFTFLPRLRHPEPRIWIQEIDKSMHYDPNNLETKTRFLNVNTHWRCDKSYLSAEWVGEDGVIRFLGKVKAQNLDGLEKKSCKQHKVCYYNTKTTQ